MRQRRSRGNSRTSSPRTSARRGREVGVKYLEQPLGGFLDSVVSGEPAPGGAAVEVLVRINTAAGGPSTTGSGVQASSPRGPAGAPREASGGGGGVFRL